MNSTKLPRFSLAAGLLLLAACSSSPATSESTQVGEESGADIGVIPSFDSDERSDVAVIDVAGRDTDDSGQCTTLGCPCADDEDCASGYCVDGGSSGAGEVCSELCADECSLPDYDCVVLVNSGGDAVQLCVPEERNFCEPCVTDRNCGRLGDVCLELLDGRHCTPPCADDTPCEEGFCTAVQVDGESRSLCVPEYDVCGACLDADEDGYGIGRACAGADCNDELDNVHEGAPELCDGFDNDCDGFTDEDTDLTSDAENCGSCGNSCAGDNGSFACVDSVCVLSECAEDWVDCDGDPATGCETSVSALNACGGCAALAADVDTPCGTCGTGTWSCDGADSLSCEGDAGADALNDCGGCETLAGEVDGPCGTCDSGVLACDGTDAVVCAGDRGDDARNACGGCGFLAGLPGSACGACSDGQYICDGSEAVTCSGATPDTDGDTICDDTDVCPGFDDLQDSDSDGVPDGCDTCPGSNDNADSDDDGVPNGCDVCSAGADSDDTDGDDIPDACDCDQAGCGADSVCAESSSGATCSCRTGYTGDGFTCNLVDCGSLPNPSNGSVSLSGTTYQSTATTTCNIGWTVQGTNPRTCQANGQWSSTPTTCYRPPGNLGCVCDRTYSVGDSVTLIANNPFAANPPIGSVGTVIAGNNTQGAAFELLVEFPGWGGGHNGRCQASNCGTCTERGSSRTYLSCSIVRPTGP